VVDGASRYGDRHDGDRGGVQRPPEVVREVYMTKTKVFRLTVLVGTMASAVAAFAAPLKW
jgi:hypothetical protein